MRHLFSLGFLCLIGCSTDSNGVTCEAGVDLDGDGLDSCEEAEIGTDPALDDSDGDGFSDSAEVECLTDPLDSSEGCYECGWKHGDPGDLSSKGSDVGDTVENIGLFDQCGEEVPLWDFAGEYHILFMTAQWCGRCQNEAQELEDRTEEFVDETALAFSYIITLFQDSLGALPNAGDAEEYWEAIEEPSFAVTSDTSAAVLAQTPYAGDALPGKCVLSPETEILACESGEDEDDWAFDVIRDDAGLTD